ncbi:DUF3263 domain-containing protein [Nocardioides marmorisolisilvae]|uniref:DUF3263 domain-containing protein n=1 Tax=Nocardioides marmorisolisilvae TaxID=1542737 RepID=A0A3N0DPA9_9ACTN|nr:DUF3263 domain-containing protein [Nocardioides marmorisolisilvae]RNL77321.1 DUF3263 domain-containing protein [Nocardioides marmorisolisilvae]
MALTELERGVLIFDATWRGGPGTSNRTAVIRHRFGLSPNQYLAVLNDSCEDPEALRIAPSVVIRRRAARGIAVQRTPKSA